MRLQITKNDMRNYKLIVDSHFSLSNETDADSMSDYFPGIWGIKTQKSALKFAKDILARGDKITVTDYDNPQYHALANKFIKELGLKQELFKEPEVIQKTVNHDNLKISNLTQLKKYLVPEVKVRSIQFSDVHGEVKRDTFVRRITTKDVILDKNGSESWLYMGKASEWTFDRNGATHYYLGRDGKQVPSIRIEYIND